MKKAQCSGGKIVEQAQLHNRNPVATEMQGGPPIYGPCGKNVNQLLLGLAGDVKKNSSLRETWIKTAPVWEG